MSARPEIANARRVVVKVGSSSLTSLPGGLDQQRLTALVDVLGAVPWHRVVAADGRLVPGHEVRARRLHAAEGTPMRGDKVDMRAAAWYPE